MTIGFILIILLALLFLFLREKRIRTLKKLKKSLKDNWGQKKEAEYFNFNQIKQYFEHILNTVSFQKIDTETVSDLDLDELFKFIDRTTSKIGQQYLYFKIRTIESADKLKKLKSLTDLFYSNEELRLKTQLTLSQLTSYDLEKLLSEKGIKKPSHLKYFYLSSVLSFSLIVLSFFYPICFVFLMPIFFINSIFHFKNKENVYYYINGVTELAKALSVGKTLSKNDEIKRHFPHLDFIKKLGAIKSKIQFIGFEKKVNSEFADIFWLLTELFKIQFMLEYIVFYRFIDDVTRERENINKLFVFIGEIDVAIAVASLQSSGATYCTPNFIEDKNIQIKEIFHPLIENCVNNNLHLEQKSLLLTGSNMSGKTTFIRTIALNAILGQTLNICFAKEYNAPFFKVFSSIRIMDNVLEGASYYLKEVLMIKKLIEFSKDTQPCLFVLDELLKGTNTIERISGGKGILSFLNKANHTVLVSTHDIELTELLVKENYDLYHFSEQICDNKLHFDYKLKKGKLETRNALKILEMYDYPQEIIADSLKTEQILTNPS